MAAVRRGPRNNRGVRVNVLLGGWAQVLGDGLGVSRLEAAPYVRVLRRVLEAVDGGVCLVVVVLEDVRVGRGRPAVGAVVLLLLLM